jgi:hypothetical protein
MARVYAIICYDTGEIYIGSTKLEMNKRMKVHKREENLCLSKQIINRGEYDVIVLETCDAKIKFQREQYWLDKFALYNIINKNAAYQTREDKHLRAIEMQRRRRHAIKPPRGILYPTEEDRKKRKVERQRERRAEQRAAKQ